MRKNLSKEEIQTLYEKLFEFASPELHTGGNAMRVQQCSKLNRAMTFAEAHPEYFSGYELDDIHTPRVFHQLILYYQYELDSCSIKNEDLAELISYNGTEEVSMCPDGITLTYKIYGR